MTCKGNKKLVSKQLGKSSASVFNDACAPLIKQEFKGSQVPLNSTICWRWGREEQVLSAALRTRTHLSTSSLATASTQPEILNVSVYSPDKLLQVRFISRRACFSEIALLISSRTRLSSFERFRLSCSAACSRSRRARNSRW